MFVFQTQTVSQSKKQELFESNPQTTRAGLAKIEANLIPFFSAKSNLGQEVQESTPMMSPSEYAKRYSKSKKLWDAFAAAVVRNIHALVDLSFDNEKDKRVAWEILNNGKFYLAENSGEVNVHGGYYDKVGRIYSDAYKGKRVEITINVPPEGHMDENAAQGKIVNLQINMKAPIKKQ